jgi:hypothetical protein
MLTMDFAGYSTAALLTEPKLAVRRKHRQRVVKKWYHRIQSHCAKRLSPMQKET